MKRYSQYIYKWKIVKNSMCHSDPIMNTLYASFFLKNKIQTNTKDWMYR